MSFWAAEHPYLFAFLIMSVLEVIGQVLIAYIKHKKGPQ